MKTRTFNAGKAVVLPGILAVVFSAWLGCAPSVEPDPEIERLKRSLEYFNEQVAFAVNANESWVEYRNATNTEEKIFWSESEKYWRRRSHEAYLKLKNN